MSSEEAREYVKRLRIGGNDGYGAEWIDPQHVATNIFRAGVIAKLSRDPQLGDGSIALLELQLAEAVPDISHFHGVFEVDEIGLWYYDGDGHINEPVWRQRVVPWTAVKSLTLYQIS